MLKALRILAGSCLIALLLEAANWAVRDCTSGVLALDNCLWLWLREKLGLPPSKLLRAGALEGVGLVLLAGLYLTFRYVLPPLRRRLPSPEDQPSSSTDEAPRTTRRPPE